MIRVLGSLKLAATKLKVHRIRLFITIFVVSLLFALLIAASLILTGFYRSFDKFSHEGLSGRYIIAGSGGPVNWNETGGTARNLKFIERAEYLQQQLIKQKESAAEELGFTYNPSPEDKAVFINPDGSKSLNVTSHIAEQVIAEHRAGLRAADETSFSSQFGELIPLRVFTSLGQGFRSDAPKLTLLEDGKEPYSIDSSSKGRVSAGLETLTQGQWRLFDDTLLEPFLLDSQTLSIDDEGSIPVIAPYSAAEHVLKLPPLSADASSTQKKERLQELRNKAGGIKFQVCYRNRASVMTLEKAIGQQSDKAANQGKANYSVPSLLLGLPQAPCSEPIVERDTRSTQEKKEFEIRHEFDLRFGKTVERNELLTFRIVGLNRDYVAHAPNKNNFTPEHLLDSALALSAGGGWLTPLSAQNKNAALADIFLQKPGSIIGANKEYYAEFATSSQAKKALIEKTCSVTTIVEAKRAAFGDSLPKTEDTPVCSREGRQFYLQPFGGNSILIDQFRASTERVMFIAGGITAIIAAIVLMSMLGRIIAESRKETAVFRALGATRLSIVAIYSTYTLYITVCIIILSLGLGLLIALTLNHYLSPSFSVAAAVAFSIRDLNQSFSFIGFDWRSLGLIIGVIAGASLLAAFVPILHSLKRNPMKDMRED